MYIEVRIDGSGDGMLANGGDPYRARLTVPGSAIIPGDSQGRPLNTTTIVWVADKFDTEVPRNIKRIPLEEGRTLVRQLDSKADLNKLEQIK